MKKLLIIGAVLFLAACSNEMSGETVTVCRTAPSHRMPIATDTVVTIEGMDEDIIVWTERITVTPSEYSQFFWGFELDEDEIREAFEWYANPVNGIGWRLISLDANTLVFDAIYYYEDIPRSFLNEIWDPYDFENDVTLSSAIRGLEAQDANCQTD